MNHIAHTAVLRTLVASYPNALTKEHLRHLTLGDLAVSSRVSDQRRAISGALRSLASHGLAEGPNAAGCYTATRAAVRCVELLELEAAARSIVSVLSDPQGRLEVGPNRTIQIKDK